MKRTLFKSLDVHEGDNIATAFAKGMAEGVIKTSVVYLGFAGAIYLLGKTLPKGKEVVETDDKETDGE